MKAQLHAATGHPKQPGVVFRKYIQLRHTQDLGLPLLSVKEFQGGRVVKPNWDLSRVVRETVSVKMKHTREHGVYSEDSTSNEQVVIVQEVSTGPPSLFLFSFFMMIIKIIRRMQRCSV